MHAKSSLPRTFVLSLCIAAVVLATSAYGRESGNIQAAASLKAQGTVAANLGRYEEAIERFSQAYSLQQDPLLLYKLAQVYRIAGQGEKALSTYSAFLRAAAGLFRYRPQIDRATAEIESITTFLLKKSTEPPAAQPTVVAKEPEQVVAAKPAAREEIAPPPLEKKTEAEPVALEPAPVVKSEPVPVQAVPAAPPPPAVNFSTEAIAVQSASTETESSPTYKRWWFWTGVAVALAAGGVATWYYAKPAEPVPVSTYGSVRVLP